MHSINTLNLRLDHKLELLSKLIFCRINMSPFNWQLVYAYNNYNFNLVLTLDNKVWFNES